MIYRQSLLLSWAKEKKNERPRKTLPLNSSTREYFVLIPRFLIEKEREIEPTATRGPP